MSKNKEAVVWVLTYEINDYDQHGEYFLEVFRDKPSLQQLAEYFGKTGGLSMPSNTMLAVAFLEHLRNGGGRQDTEREWYYLREVVLK